MTRSKKTPTNRPRSSVTRWLLAWTAALLVGGVTATALTGWMDDRQERIERRTLAERIAYDQHRDVVPEPIDLVRKIATDRALVVVAPELADQVSSTDLAAARAALTDAEVPGRLAYLPYPETDSGYTTSGLPLQWMEAIGTDGHYVVLWNRSGLTESTGRGMADEYLSTETKGQPGKALVRIAEEMATWPQEPAEGDTPPSRSTNSYWGGRGGGIAAGLLFGGLTVVPLLGIAWAVAAHRARKEP